MKRVMLVCVLVLAGCPSKEEAPPPAAGQEAPPPAAAVVPAEPPTDAARARAAALREQQTVTTDEIRAAWALKACEAGCDERQRAIATRLSSAAQLVPYTRDEAPVGLMLMRVQAYSPWIACRLEPNDLLKAVEGAPVRGEEDIPRVIRACVLGQALSLERRGKPVELPARPAVSAPAKAPEEILPPGTRDLE
ncbi:MAG: hypothetical protein P1V51_17660 [Deltaproteobacteria bacterium]|nr:hypothetical protein [Deltaproteobacteria bacterium]